MEHRGTPWNIVVNHGFLRFFFMWHVHPYVLSWSTVAARLVGSFFVGYLKLIDFGIAKKLDEGKTRTFTMYLGSPWGRTGLNQTICWWKTPWQNTMAKKKEGNLQLGVVVGSCVTHGAWWCLSPCKFNCAVGMSSIHPALVGVINHHPPHKFKAILGAPHQGPI
jgi:hypothetical protein